VPETMFVNVPQSGDEWSVNPTFVYPVGRVNVGVPIPAVDMVKAPAEGQANLSVPVVVEGGLPTSTSVPLQAEEATAVGVITTLGIVSTRLRTAWAATIVRINNRKTDDNLFRFALSIAMALTTRLSFLRFSV